MPELSERDMRILAFERRRLAVAGGEGAGHRRGARHARHPLLPAAERADRPARSAGVRPGAGQAAARAAGPPAARYARRGRQGTKGSGSGMTPGRCHRHPGGPGLAWPRWVRAPGAGADRARLRRHAGPDRVRPDGRPPAPRGGRGPGRAGRAGRDPRRDHRPARRSRHARRPGPDLPGLIVLGQLRQAALGGGHAHRAARPAGRGHARAGSCPRCWPRRAPPRAPGPRTRATRWPCTPAWPPSRNGPWSGWRAPLAGLAERAGLAVQPGRMVIELRPPGGDKGTALKDPAGRPNAGPGRSCSAATIWATGRPSRRSARCGPTACPAAPWPAAQRRVTAGRRGGRPGGGGTGGGGGAAHRDRRPAP